MFDIDEKSPKFGRVLSVFNYRTSMPGVKLLDGPPHGRELSEIALSPVDNNVVLLNIKRTNLVCYNIASHSARLVDVKCLNLTNKSFLFGATFSYNGKVTLLHVAVIIASGLFVSTVNNGVCKIPFFQTLSLWVFCIVKQFEARKAIITCQCPPPPPALWILPIM